MKTHKFIICLLFLVGIGTYYFNYILYPVMYDDSYIGYRISENIANGYGMVFNKGEKLWVNTSFLYPLYNSIIFKFGGDNAIHLAIVSDVIFYLLALYLVYLIVLDIISLNKELNPTFRHIFLIVAVLLMASKVSSGATCGMESLFYTFFITLSFFLFFRKQYYPAFVLAALCFWIRPEGCLVALSMYGCYMIQEKKVFV